MRSETAGEAKFWKVLESSKGKTEDRAASCPAWGRLPPQLYHPEQGQSWGDAEKTQKL